MSLLISTENVRKARNREEEPNKKIAAAIGAFLSVNNGYAVKTDCVIATFSNGPLYTVCKLVLRDHGNYIGTYRGISFGLHQKPRACRAFGNATINAGIKITGRPCLWDKKAGFVVLRAVVKAILKKMRFENEYTSAAVY
jgi:hypothetical protein